MVFHARAGFVEFAGATDRELKAVRNKGISVKELYKKPGSDIISYHRDSVILILLIAICEIIIAEVKYR